MTAVEKEDEEITPGKFKEWFDRAQVSYSAWENGLWDSLGGFGAWMKKRRNKKVPAWKRVQSIWIWLCILALISGWNVGGFYYQYQCNKHIVEEFYPEVACLNSGLKCDMSKVNPGLLALLNQSELNESMKDLPLLGREEVES